MKNLLLIFIALIFFSSYSITANAAVYGDFVYTTQTSGNVTTATITAYTGTDAFVTIPSSVISGANEYTVNKIGTNSIGGAFQQNEYIKKVIIPETVIEIGGAAFAECLNLEYVEIAGTVDIKTLAFSDCVGLRTVIFLSDVNSIRNKAFMNCDNLAVIYFKGALPVLCERGDIYDIYEHIFYSGTHLFIPNLIIYANSYDCLDFSNLSENYYYDVFDEHTWKNMPVKINSDISLGFDAGGDIVLTVGNVGNITGKTLICAVYQNNKMFGVGFDTITNSEEYTFAGLADCIDNLEPGDYFIKSFILSDTGNIVPLSLASINWFEKPETNTNSLSLGFFGFSVSVSGAPEPVSVYSEDDRTYTVYDLSE